MRDAVRDGRQPLDLANVRAEALNAKRRDVRFPHGFREAPHAAPDPAGRALLEQDFAGASEREHDGTPLRQCLARLTSGQYGDETPFARDAMSRPRAFSTARPTARADACAQIHEPLGIDCNVAPWQ